MELWLILIMVLGFLLIALFIGLHVAFAFFLVNLFGFLFLIGGEASIQHILRVTISGLANFSTLPIVMFVLMGELIFVSGVAFRAINVLDGLLGRMPGRLSLLAVAAGTLFSVLSGSTNSSVLLLGSILVPEMEKRGYKEPMTLGPILGSGGIAMMIPPSAYGVFLAAVAQIPIGALLMAIIIPGILMAVFYTLYIVIRCMLQPDLAPVYQVEKKSFKENLFLIARDVLPLSLIVFLVIGLVLLGIATPSESAALGCVGTLVLIAAYRQFDLKKIYQATFETARITVMLFTIFASARVYGQLLSFSGLTNAIINWVAHLDISPMGVIVMMQIIVLIMGCFMEIGSIAMIVMPIFMPIVYVLGFNPIWFGTLMMINIEMATTSPPLGSNLFAMKSVLPPETPMASLYKGALPFLGCDALVMLLVMFFPNMVLWLPSMASV